MNVGDGVGVSGAISCQLEEEELCFCPSFLSGGLEHVLVYLASVEELSHSSSFLEGRSWQFPRGCDG